ncbi:ParB/RepB/Spo0J family partition protein [Castellaniella sp.]|uniref:ParB/RepB/Spo0J family partition protein n=1 Tax=Castellaniella sp. TaxID=1955812 RepID=UPI003A93DB12
MDTIAAPRYAEIPLSRITPSKTNPRKTFPEQTLEELAQNIGKFGILQPILLRPAPDAPLDPEPFYEVVAGERRYRASLLAGLATVPATVRDISDMDMLELQIIENLQREDPHPLEEAEGYEALLEQHKADPDYNVDAVAAKVNKSRSYIYARMKLCALRPAARKAFYDGQLNASTALLLARIPVPELQDKALKEITDGGWPNPGQPMPVRQAARHIQQHYMTRLDLAPFDLADETLLPDAGPCTTCPKRTGANPDLFSDVGDADVCTDPVCFTAKKEAFQARARSTAIDRGKTVISGKAAQKIKPSQYESDLKGYVNIEASPWWMESDKKVKNILKGEMPETVLIEDPHSGDLIEAIPEDAARSALKAAGIKISRAASSYNAGQRDQEKKAKAERGYRRALLAEIHRNARTHFAADGKFTIDEMREIAYKMYRDIGADLRPTIAALWAWPGQDLDAVRLLVHQQGVPELALLMLMCIRAPSTYCGPWSNDLKTPDELLQACAQYGVDPEEVKARTQLPTVKPASKKKALAGSTAAEPLPATESEAAA